jgi:hypothetical protein
MSRANADAPHRLIRTRLLNRKNSAFAASKRTAKTEKRSRIESKDLLVRLGEGLNREHRASADIKFWQAKAERQLHETAAVRLFIF